MNPYQNLFNLLFSDELVQPIAKTFKFRKAAESFYCLPRTSVHFTNLKNLRE